MLQLGNHAVSNKIKTASARFFGQKVSDRLILLEGCRRRHDAMFRTMLAVEYVYERCREAEYFQLIVHTVGSRVHHVPCGLNHRRDFA